MQRCPTENRESPWADENICDWEVWLNLIGFQVVQTPVPFAPVLRGDGLGMRG